MDKPSDYKEKRRHPRSLVNIPVNLSIIGESKRSPGMISDASETGLLVNTVMDMDPGTRVIIETSLSPKEGPANFKAVTKVVWKDMGLWDDLEGYVYGVKFIRILDGDHVKIKQILGRQSHGEKPNQG